MTIDQYKQIAKTTRTFMKTLTVADTRTWVRQNGLLNQNTKLKKRSTEGILNYGLELLPSTLSGKNLCGKDKTCRYICLAYSGINNILHGRKLLDQDIITPALANRARRTFLYLKDHKFFMQLLQTEISNLQAKADRENTSLAIRLNVFSDIDWRDFIKQNPDTQFYDYTKHWDRKGLKNYNLTFSYSEDQTPGKAIRKLKAGNNVAMVFENSLPKKWNKFPVKDGDNDDSRYLDKNGVIIGLKVKTTLGGKTSNTFTQSANR